MLRTRLLTPLASLALVMTVSASAVSAQETPTAPPSVTFSKPLIIAFPTASTNDQSFGLRRMAAAQNELFATNPCDTGTAAEPSDPNGNTADVPQGPPPTAFMAVLLTNNTDQMQSYLIHASRTSDGASLGQSVAAYVRPGKSSIPMFVLTEAAPAVEDVSFLVEPFVFPPLPCDNSPETANLHLGAATLDGMNVLVPVTNLDQTGYNTMVQAGLLQGDQLVAVAMGSVVVGGGETQTANLYLAFPFGITEAPASTSVVPALMPFGVQKAD